MSHRRPSAVALATTLVSSLAQLGDPAPAHAVTAAYPHEASSVAQIKSVRPPRDDADAIAVASARPRDPWRVQADIVAPLVESAPLGGLVSEWFQLNAIRADIRQTTRLDANEVLRDASDKSLLRIWVTFVRVDQARLYFVEPSGRRFLLRDVPLRTQFDEVAREQLAQVIVTAAKAFMDQLASTPAEDFTRALRTSADTLVPAEPRQTRIPKPAPATPQLTPNFGALYQLQLQRGATLMHGPGVVLGVAYPSLSYRFVAALKGQYSWSRTVDLPEVKLDFAATAFRATFGVTRRVAPSTEAGVELGSGADYVSFVPARGRDTSIEPTSPASLWRPAVIFDVRGSFVARRTRWSLLLGASGYLERSEYAVLRDGIVSVVYAPFLVEPHAALEVSLE